MEDLRFDVAYTVHGGSGLGITWGETAELELGELQRLRSRIVEFRELEVAAMRRTGQKGRR